MNSASVSVIVAVFNGEAFIRDAIDSARKQTVAPLEIIVVDDGSTDRTVQLVQDEPGVTLIQQRNAGASAARNVAVARASGDWIGFLDADDLWLPHKLERQLALAASRPELEIVAGNHLPFLEPGTACPRWLNPQHLVEGAGCFMSSILLVRREVFSRVGLFNESLRFAEDFEWVARTRDAGVLMGSVQEIILHKRVHGTNTTHHLKGAQNTVAQTLLQIVRQRRDAASSP